MVSTKTLKKIGDKNILLDNINLEIIKDWTSKMY